MSCLQRNKILMLIITNECNLNCSYCYQEHREKIEGVGVEVTEYVENIDDYKNLDDIIDMITLFNDKEHTE